MNKLEHVAEAERLLASAKDVMRASTGFEDKASASTFLNLLDVARVHAAIAAALDG